MKNQTEIYEPGSKLLAVAGCMVMFCCMSAGATWAFVYVIRRLLLIAALAVIGCSEFRAGGTCKSLFQEVTVSLEVVR